MQHGTSRVLEFRQALILFTSDNGFFFGEHGLSIERRLPYEEAIRCPLLVRHPPSIEAGRTVDGLVSSIDIAPSVLQFAGLEPNKHIQGTSFLPLLRGARGQASKLPSNVLPRER